MSIDFADFTGAEGSSMQLRFARFRFVSLGRETLAMRASIGSGSGLCIVRRCEAMRWGWHDTIRYNWNGERKLERGERERLNCRQTVFILVACNTRVTLYSLANFPNDLVVLLVFSLNTTKLWDKPKPVKPKRFLPSFVAARQSFNACEKTKGFKKENWIFASGNSLAERERWIGRERNRNGNKQREGQFANFWFPVNSFGLPACWDRRGLSGAWCRRKFTIRESIDCVIEIQLMVIQKCQNNLWETRFKFIASRSVAWSVNNAIRAAIRAEIKLFQTAIKAAISSLHTKFWRSFRGVEITCCCQCTL